MRRVRALAWDELHGGRALVLFFESVVGAAPGPDFREGLLALNERGRQGLGPRVNAAVVCRDTSYDVLEWLGRFSDPEAFWLPMIADPDERITSMYDVLSDDGIPLSGRMLVDREGLVREIVLGDVPFPTDVDALLRQVQAL